MEAKVVLVTGLGSGMGREIALFLSAHGFIVYAGTRDIKNINQVADKIYKSYNQLDILINNAGYGLVSTVENLRVCKAIIPIMREKGVRVQLLTFSCYNLHKRGNYGKKNEN